MLELEDIAEERRVATQILDGSCDAVLREDLLQSHVDDTIVLDGRQRAGGVDQTAAWSQETQAVGQDACLELWYPQALLYARRLENIVVLLVEHMAIRGAGHVDQDLVELLVLVRLRASLWLRMRRFPAQRSL